MYSTYKHQYKTLLTGELHSCLPADDRPERVGGDALIHSSVIDDMRIIDQQVPLHEAVVGLRLCVQLSPIHFPPAEKSQNNHHHRTQTLGEGGVNHITLHTSQLRPASTSVLRRKLHFHPPSEYLGNIQKASHKGTHGGKCNYPPTSNE